MILSLSLWLASLLPHAAWAQCPRGKSADPAVCSSRNRDPDGCCDISSQQGPHNPQKAIEMVLFPPGEFTMGSATGDPDEQPAHTVILSRPFWMMKTEVTQKLYIHVTGDNPSWFKQCGIRCPVEEISWFDALHFANELSKSEGLEECYQIRGETVEWPRGLDCLGYRLPTEAEWEYAAKGGSDSTYPWGSTDASCAQAILFEGGGRGKDGCGQRSPWPVCSKTGGNTPQGLCDMGGNIWEWVWDGFGIYDGKTVTDPLGDPKSEYKVFKGGSWKVFGHYLRNAGRSSELPGMRNYLIGFRLARTASETPR